MGLKMNKLIILRENKNKVVNAKDVFNQIKKINIDYEQENFILLFFNSNLNLIGSEIAFKGGA